MRSLHKGPLVSGVTSYCPTVVTSSADNYHAVLPHLGPRPGGGGPDDLGAEVLGAHLEGPFISRFVRPCPHLSVRAVEGSKMGCLSDTSCFGFHCCLDLLHALGDFGWAWWMDGKTQNFKRRP